ncbi:MAG TPA: class I SAM-dependent methyltransferase [Vicinamibacterales bacterium]|nr:class I SAM-dependent methyltransferase [Vicinamibacterales bacterium]
MTVASAASRGSSALASTRAAQRFWERYFAVYDTLNEAAPYQDMIARQVARLAPSTGARVLDAGTGSGNLAAALAQKGADVVGIDFCEPALDIARRKAPGATFLFGDLTRPLPFADGSFDAVSCSAVLHVLTREDQRAAIAELARVLRPGGRLVVTAFAEGFSALSVYAETLREARRARGMIGCIAFGLRYSWNTARILYYVSRIQRQHRRGAYAYVDEAALNALLASAALDSQSMERTLAGQCITATARKPGSRE